MKLYLVYTPRVEYDEYDTDSAQIVGIFDTQEKANEIKEEEHGEIIEIELNKEKQFYTIY